MRLNDEYAGMVLHSMTKGALEKLANEAGVPVQGKRADLAQSLVAACHFDLVPKRK